MARCKISGIAAALALGSLACSSAYADRIAPAPRHHKPLVKVAAPKRVSPYKVELIAANGRSLSTFNHRGRFYVLGKAGTRYSVRVRNPTNRRVEAVISVDGLDVIDGQSADFVRKRGYVVPPRGTLKVDGFRVSTSHVAAFRFSSVSNSYAARKGKARNVGVVGVAFFAEKARPEIIVRRPYPRPRPHWRWQDRNRYRKPYPSKDYKKRAPAPKSDDAAEAPTPPSGAKRGGSRGTVVGGNTGAPAPSRPNYRYRHKRPSHCCTARPNPRPGLGTKFGERRYSAATWTRFERANPRVPTAIATLRYNDSSGLTALGIRLPHKYVSRDELATRETANPFPGSRFAQPPR